MSACYGKAKIRALEPSPLFFAPLLSEALVDLVELTTVERSPSQQQQVHRLPVLGVGFRLDPDLPGEEGSPGNRALHREQPEDRQFLSLFTHAAPRSLLLGLGQSVSVAPH